MSTVFRYFGKEFRKQQYLSLLLLYMTYPELKRQYYDNFLKDQNEENYNIKRKHIKLTNQQQKDIEEEFEDCGFDFHEAQGFDWAFLNFWTPQYYWENRAAYEFQPKQVDELMQATFQVQSMCLEAIDFVIQNPVLLSKAFNIPPELHDTIIKSWKNSEKDLIGRLDFLYNEQQGFKFIEANADTPTVLLEAGLAQEIWAEHTDKQQFNLISQTISNAWKQILENKGFNKLVGLSYGVVKDSTKTETEDKCNVRYLINLADSVFNSDDIHLQDIRYLDDYLLDNNKLNKTCIWKLYPYEWLVEESAGIHFDKDHQQNPNVKLMEPAWKLIMANKAILPILWAMYPDNKYLLPSFFTVQDTVFANEADDKLSYKDAVGKRVFGREGKNVTLGSDFSSFYEFISKSNSKGNSEINHTLGQSIFQKYYRPKKFTGRSITIGSWVVYGLPAGLGIREDIQDITNNNSSFVPHYVSEQQKFNNSQDSNFDLEIQNQYKSNSEFQQNDGFSSYQNVYQPQNNVQYSMSQNQSYLRYKLYGKDNNISNIYNQTPLQSKINLQSQSNDFALQSKDKKQVLEKINSQIQNLENNYLHAQQINKEEKSNRRSGSRVSYFSNSFGNDYQSSNQEKVQSSASKDGISQARRADRQSSSGTPRQRTGSFGRGFSSSS